MGRVTRSRGIASLFPPLVPAPCQGCAWRCSCEEKAAPRTCSSPPAWGAARRAEGGGRGATAAAPEPGAAARPTARAWPAAGAPPTWAPTASPAGPCRVRLQPKVTRRRAKLMLHPRPHSSGKTLPHPHSHPCPRAGPAHPDSVGLSYPSVGSCDPPQDAPAPRNPADALWRGTAVSVNFLTKELVAQHFILM